MKSLTEKLIDSGHANRVLNDTQLRRLLTGSDASRYGLVNRALKVGELHRVKRALYVLDNKYRDFPLTSICLGANIGTG